MELTLSQKPHFNTARMTPIEDRLRELIAKAKTEGVPLRRIAREAEVGYFQVHNFISGRSPVIRANVAEKIIIVLTGKGLSL